MNPSIYTELRNVYFGRDPRAGRARDLFRALRSGRIKRRMSNLLCHHDDSEISEADTYRRDDFDMLLSFFSMVEIACIAGITCYPPNGDDRKLGLDFLGDRDVWSYYVENYPQVLPELHLYRIRGIAALEAPPLDDYDDLFATFFDLTWFLESDDDLDTFLWFLDDGVRNGEDFDSVVGLLERPKKVAQILGNAKIKKKDETPAEFVRGFLKFVRSAETLDSLLQSCAEPLLRSAMWSAHSSWIESFSRRLGARLESTIATITDLSADAKPDRPAGSPAGRLDDQPVVRDARGTEILAAFSRLNSGRDAWRIREETARIRYGLPGNPPYGSPGWDPFKDPTRGGGGEVQIGRFATEGLRPQRAMQRRALTGYAK